MKIHVEGEDSPREGGDRPPKEEGERGQSATPPAVEDRVTLQRRDDAEEKEGEGGAEESLESLRQALAQKKQEAVGLYERLLRTQAEFENYKKRSDREREEYTRYAARCLITSLLPVLDNLERAIKAAEDGAGGGSLIEGVRLIHQQLVSVLEEVGVSAIPAQGRPFDPMVHDAVVTVPSAGEEPEQEMVADEVLRGYKLFDRVLRPAKVAVFKTTKGEVER